MSKPERGTGARGSNSTYEFHLGGRCGLTCAVCDCRNGPTDPARRAAGAARLVLRGTPSNLADVTELVQRARAEGTAQVVVRTTGLDAMSSDAAGAFAATGADVALVPLFSSVAAVHDRIAGRPLALSHALVGMRSLAEAGMGIEIEIPLLSPKLQDLEAVIALARRAVPSLSAVRFFVSTEKVPAVLAPPSWSEARPRLVAAIRACRALGISALLTQTAAVPLCALGDEVDLHDAFRFDPKRKVPVDPRCVHPGVCGSCAARPQCPGVTQAYVGAHGDAGLVPFAKKPARMYAQRTPGSPVFTVEHKKLAAGAGMLVLRPTVNCNQDCTFCSANETSNNVWTEPREMLRSIVRAAQRKLGRVSFGGGEPTLARDLVHYIDAARRLGIPKIELVTNAVLLDQRRRVHALREAGLTDAFVSLHAHDERLSQSMTRKAGDFAKTTAGIGNLLAEGVETVVNHVVNSRNYLYLSKFVEFLHGQFGGRALISFAFVTPQFKVLEDMSQVPRLSDVTPHLRRALHRALELGQPVKVGSRQGIPPCLLGEFRGFSDVLDYGAEPLAEDAPQKQRAPGCDTCRYTRHCTGLWRPYVAQYGLSELRPIPGAPLTEADLPGASSMWSSTRVALSFDDLPSALRDPLAEAQGRAWYEANPVVPPPLRSLPLLASQRSRPVRLVVAGSGRQAKRLARAAMRVGELSVDGVASPHAPDSDLRDFGACSSFRSMDEAIAEMRPEAVLIAAATHVHHALAMSVVAQGIPALIEKPLVRTEDEAIELVRLVAATPGAVLVPAHNMLFAAGVDALFEALPRREGDGPPSLVLSRRVTATGPEAMRAWSRSALFESLYHTLSLVGHAAGGGVPRVLTAMHRGGLAPTQVRVELRYDGADAEISLDFTAAVDDLSLSRGVQGEKPTRIWRRVGSTTTLQIDGRDVSVPRSGNDVERMLGHFRDVVLGRTPPLLGPADALDVMRATRAVIDALEDAGAPFHRAEGPRHVASPTLARFPDAHRR